MNVKDKDIYCVDVYVGKMAIMWLDLRILLVAVSESVFLMRALDPNTTNKGRDSKSSHAAK